ncbi:MAG: DUF1552 domain-containing protein [Verrucomicrobiales bacterium]
MPPPEPDQHRDLGGSDRRQLCRALTSLPSLELATMPQTHKENQEGLNEGYYSHCSFRSPTQAVPAETNPRSVLERLFGTSHKPGQVTQRIRSTGNC